MEDNKAKLKRVHDCILKYPLATIATVSQNAEPDLAAVYVSIEEDMTCNFVSKSSTRKHANIKQNGKAALSFTNEKDLTFVELSGTASILDFTVDGERMAKILEKMNTIILDRRLFCWIPPVSQVGGMEYSFFEFKPSDISFFDFTDLTEDVEKPPVHFTLSL